MSLAKGLEFRAVVVMARDEGIPPLDERVADAADEAELDDIYETERRLLYVACTRAREHLLLTGVVPICEYLADFTLISAEWDKPQLGIGEPRSDSLGGESLPLRPSLWSRPTPSAGTPRNAPRVRVRTGFAVTG